MEYSSNFMIEFFMTVFSLVALPVYVYYNYKHVLRYLYSFQNQDYDTGMFTRTWLCNHIYVEKLTLIYLVYFVLNMVVYNNHFPNFESVVGFSIPPSFVSFLFPVFLLVLAASEPNPTKLVANPLVWTTRARRIFVWTMAMTVAACLYVPFSDIVFITHDPNIGFVIVAQFLPLMVLLANWMQRPYQRFLEATLPRSRQES